MDKTTEGELQEKFKRAEFEINKLTEVNKKLNVKINNLTVDNDIKGSELSNVRRQVSEQDKELERLYIQNGQLERGILKIIRMIGESVEDE